MLRREEGKTPRYYLLEAYETMELYQQGTAPDFINADVFQRLEKCVADCQKIFGSQYDYQVQEG